MPETDSDLERMLYDRLVCSENPESVRRWIPLTMSKDADLAGASIQPGLVYAILSVRPTTWWHSCHSDLQIQWKGGSADLYLTRTGRIVVYLALSDEPEDFYLIDNTRYAEPFDNREWCPAGDDIMFFRPSICVEWRTAWLALAHIFMFGKRGEDSPWISVAELHERFGRDLVQFNVFDPPHPEPLYWGP